MVRTLNLPFEAAEYKAIERWKHRVSEAVYGSPNELSWPELLLLYANDDTIPVPKRGVPQ